MAVAAVLAETLETGGAVESDTVRQMVEEGMGHGTHERFEQVAVDLKRRVRGV